MNGKDVQFFMDNAGFGYDPETETPEEGKRHCAVRLAMAEEWAKVNKIHFQWWDDPDYTVGKDDDLDPEECSQPYLCIAGPMTAGPFDRIDVAASLGGILFAKGEDYSSAPYTRVIEAELALEIMWAAKPQIR